MSKDTAISSAVTPVCEWPAEIRLTPWSFLKRARYLVEETDWDRKALKWESGIDRICWISIAIAALYFLPVFFSILSR